MVTLTVKNVSNSLQWPQLLKNQLFQKRVPLLLKFIKNCQQKEDRQQMRKILSKLQKKYEILSKDDKTKLKNLIFLRMKKMNEPDLKVNLQIQKVSETLKSCLNHSK